MADGIQTSLRGSQTKEMTTVRGGRRVRRKESNGREKERRTAVSWTC